LFVPIRRVRKEEEQEQEEDEREEREKMWEKKKGGNTFLDFFD